VGRSLSTLGTSKGMLTSILIELVEFSRASLAQMGSFSDLVPTWTAH
jgi:hypothetical protein